MAYLGNTPSETFHQATSQVFNGDGSTTAFTLEKRVNRAEEIEVFVNNIQQQPTVAYTANNTTLTFTEAPDSATGNIYVVYRMFAQQNTFNALHDFTDAVTMASTLSVTGNTTVTGSVITSTGFSVGNTAVLSQEIDVSSGNFTLDVAGDITLDADGGDVKINDGGSARFHILTSATETQLFNQQQDADIVFKGDDGGSAITALTLDMSDGGRASFAHNADFVDGRGTRFGASQDLQIYHDGSNSYINDTGTGSLIIEGANVQIQDTQQDLLAKFNNAGAVQLYHVDSGTSVVKLATSGTGLTVTGNIAISDGNGIDFSADANASAMASELLDDFERGSWTPVLEGASGASSVAYTRREGGYTKVGKKVTANFHIVLSSEGTINGAPKISGLPYIGDSNPLYQVATIMSGNMSIDKDQQLTGMQFAGNAFIYLMIQESDVALVQPSGNGIFKNNSEMVGSVTYFTNS